MSYKSCSNGSAGPPVVNGITQPEDSADENGLTLEELGAFHEDILDQNVDAVHDIVQEFQVALT